LDENKIKSNLGKTTPLLEHRPRKKTKTKQKAFTPKNEKGIETEKKKKKKKISEEKNKQLNKRGRISINNPRTNKSKENKKVKKQKIKNLKEGRKRGNNTRKPVLASRCLESGGSDVH